MHFMPLCSRLSLLRCAADVNISFVVTVCGLVLSLDVPRDLGRLARECFFNYLLGSLGADSNNLCGVVSSLNKANKAYGFHSSGLL